MAANNVLMLKKREEMREQKALESAFKVRTGSSAPAEWDLKLTLAKYSSDYITTA